MIKVALETEDRVRLVVEDPPPGVPLGNSERAEFQVEICTSPLCHCRDVRFVEETGDWLSADRPPRKFVLDPFRKCPAEPDPTQAPESGRLAQQVAAALSADAWTRLTAVFLAVKARAIAAIDCERELAHFPFDEVERDGMLVSYRETIPFDQEIIATRGSRQVLVDELHCVRPGCDCSDALLLLHEVDRTPRPDGVRGATPIAALRVDHRRDHWADADTGKPLNDEALELRRLILAQYPRLLATLGRQQTLMRDLYRAAAADAGRLVDAPPPALVAEPRVGRNDLCPCGSGKKYKKCCLAS